MSSASSSPSSERRIRAARANGALSRGPVTPEGKAASAANSLRHGLCAHPATAETALLANEDTATFEQFHQSLVGQYRPKRANDAAAVEELAVALWRVRRAWAVESTLLDHEMDTMAADLEREMTDPDRATRIGLAFKSLSDNSRSLQNLLRYESRLARQADRLRAQLSTRKKYRTNPIPKSDT